MWRGTGCLVGYLHLTLVTAACEYEHTKVMACHGLRRIAADRFDPRGLYTLRPLFYSSTHGK